MSVSTEARAGFHLSLRSDEAQVSTPPLFFCAETLHLRCSPSSDPVYNDATSLERCCPRVEAKKPRGGDPPGLGKRSWRCTVPLLISLEVVLQRSFLLQHRPPRPRHLPRRRSSPRPRIWQSQAACSHLQAPLWHQVPEPAGTGEKACLRPSFREDPRGAAPKKGTTKEGDGLGRGIPNCDCRDLRQMGGILAGGTMRGWMGPTRHRRAASLA